ncbi:MAG: hypothetical protein ACT4NY_28270 [Pseudonocardiales bacterium]
MSTVGVNFGSAIAVAIAVVAVAIAVVAVAIAVVAVAIAVVAVAIAVAVSSVSSSSGAGSFFVVASDAAPVGAAPVGAAPVGAVSSVTAAGAGSVVVAAVAVPVIVIYGDRWEWGHDLDRCLIGRWRERLLLGELLWLRGLLLRELLGGLLLWLGGLLLWLGGLLLGELWLGELLLGELWLGELLLGLRELLLRWWLLLLWRPGRGRQRTWCGLSHTHLSGGGRTQSLLGERVDHQRYAQRDSEGSGQHGDARIQFHSASMRGVGECWMSGP